MWMMLQILNANVKTLQYIKKIKNEKNNMELYRNLKKLKETY
jgi:hypothetical protein